MLKKALGYFFFILGKMVEKNMNHYGLWGGEGGTQTQIYFFLRVFTYLGVCICRDYGEGHEGHHQEDKH